MKKSLLFLFIVIPVLSQASVTELTDQQMSVINGKANGLLPGIVFPGVLKPNPVSSWSSLVSNYHPPKYTTLSLTDNPLFNKPLEGFSSVEDNFKGIHYINMIHNFGVDEDYRNYVKHGDEYTSGIIKITDSGDGSQYSVIGDVWRSERSDDGSFEASKSNVVEEYYRVMNADGTMTNKALRWSKWNRDINMTKW
ncbi:hypothetical protein A2I42_08905 [Salmonella enterica]|uniref:Uncharacterized protein n=1 Tax=Salmonella enterica TaxID=28901 RepID=A0A402WM00_SALER|nr:hypothetical protein [Salmonella enterica]EAS2063688.1 hypothetical protein [Salmonella enterica]EAS2070511.1 hypothetical protein [Salmonella enterica]EAX5489304.1 hypothetical protein [Salmonella enterica]ECW3987904.1 hypothetical protein [Salmonella enterica]